MAYFTNNVKKCMFFFAISPSFLDFIKKKNGIITWTISNNFCLILSPLCFFLFFWGGGAEQDMAPMTLLEISSLVVSMLDAHYYFSNAVLGCSPPPFITDQISKRLSLCGYVTVSVDNPLGLGVMPRISKAEVVNKCHIYFFGLLVLLTICTTKSVFSPLKM